MDLQEILERFSIITNLSMDEVSPWIPLCEDASQEIERNLKEGANTGENSRRLNAAVAALAFYRYVLYRASGGGMESFTAGELRIRTNSQVNVKIAYEVWMGAKSAIADLLVDDNFMFERIV